MGFCSEFLPILTSSDILVHTSRTESQGRVILEAMAAKLPVVAYNVGGVGEAVVPGETGFLREFGNIEGMTADLQLLVENKQLRHAMGGKGYHRVKESFSAVNTANQVRKTINNILA